MFGILAFTSNAPAVVYRFANDELMKHLDEIFTRKYRQPPPEGMEIDPSTVEAEFDDLVTQQFAIIACSFGQSLYKSDPLRRIRLENGSQIFFDQLGDHILICMADKSFDTIIVLKTINLLKASIKYHLGVLPFTYEHANGHIVNRISSSLQYFLAHATTSQSLMFESCERLYINELIRVQCRETCVAITEKIQRRLKAKGATILITCKDKIVHTHHNSNVRLSNADLFLLLLNTNSRCFREGFDSQPKLTRVMGHIFDTSIHLVSTHQSQSTRSSFEASSSTDSFSRRESCPGFSAEELARARNNLKQIHRSEVIFMKTTDHALAPFTLLTIPLTENISILVLVQWETSGLCSHLYELIHHLDSCVRSSKFSTDHLAEQTKRVESHDEFIRFLKMQNCANDFLSKLLAKATRAYRNSLKSTNAEREDHGSNVMKCLQDMNFMAKKAFEEFFHKKDDYGHRSSFDIDIVPPVEPEMTDPCPDQSRARLRRNEYDVSPMIKDLQKLINKKLGDWFAFIEVKGQRNITMNFCQNDFPGLVHFVFIDRRRGLICSPQLIPDDPQLVPNGDSSQSEYVLEKKILAFELECLAALQNGFTSYTIADDHFIYKYALTLQESNGASVPLYKSVVQSHPPSILHFDFYNSLIEKNSSSNSNQTKISCSELIAIHLNVVPAGVIQEQLQKLFCKVMEYDE